MVGGELGGQTGHYVLVVTVAAADVRVSAVNQAGGHWVVLLMLIRMFPLLCCLEKCKSNQEH